MRSYALFSRWHHHQEGVAHITEAQSKVSNDSKHDELVRS